MIGITMTFLRNKFSFKSDLYFMRYMHANTKNKVVAPNKLSFQTLCVLITKSTLTLLEKIVKFEFGHQNQVLDGCGSTLNIFL